MEAASQAQELKDAIMSFIALFPAAGIVVAVLGVVAVGAFTLKVAYSKQR